MLIAQYDSLLEAAKSISLSDIKTIASSISHHCRTFTAPTSRYKHSYGYQWRLEADTGKDLFAITPMLTLEPSEKIIQVDMLGNIVKEHDSIYIAASHFTSNLASGATSIRRSLKNQSRKSFGFRWQYA